MRQFSWTLKDALDFVKAARPIINPNPGFWKQLGAYEQELYGKNRSTLMMCVDLEAEEAELAEKDAINRGERPKTKKTGDICSVCSVM